MSQPDRYGCKDTRWRTPLDLAQDVRGVFGGQIGLDPCTEPGNHLRAERFYVPSGTDGIAKEYQDGLVLPWQDRTWCNPPYGPRLPEWLLKAQGEASLGHRIGLLLSVSRTETSYFQSLILSSSCFQFQKGKLRHSEGNSAMLASWVFWFNVDPGTVEREMGWRGVICTPF